MIIIPIALAFAFSNTTAADTITVGHKALRGAELRVGADTTDIFAVRDGQRQQVSTGITTISMTDKGFMIVFVSQTRNGPSVDSIEVARGTLAPIRHVESFPAHYASMTFANGHVTGKERDSTGTRDLNLSISANRFDFSVIQQVTNSLPLAVGYSAVVLGYDVSPRTDRAIGFEVVAQESIAWHDKQVSTWKTVTDFGTHKVTRWTDVKTRRDIKFEIADARFRMEGVLK